MIGKQFLGESTRGKVPFSPEYGEQLLRMNIHDGHKYSFTELGLYFSNMGRHEEALEIFIDGTKRLRCSVCAFNAAVTPHIHTETSCDNLWFSGSGTALLNFLLFGARP